MKRLQSFVSRISAAAGLLGLLLVSFAPGAFAQNIRIEPHLHHSSTDLPAADVIADFTPNASPVLDAFEFTLLYDRSRITPAGVLPPEDNRFEVAFVITHVDSLLPGQSVIRIVGHRAATANPPAAATFVLARVVFRPVAPVGVGETTPLSFFWTDCRSNSLFADNPNAFFVAGCTRDPDGADITSALIPPPTATGICDNCLLELTHGDTLLLRDLTFESAHFPLDISTAVEPDNPPALPTSATLHQNYPNPFNSGTTIRFTLPHAGAWRLDIYDITGRLVRTFTDRSAPGETALTWDGLNSDRSPLATGVYFYRLTAGEFTATRRLLLLR